MSTAWTQDERRPRDARHFAQLVRYCVGLDVRAGIDAPVVPSAADQREVTPRAG